MGEVFNVLTSKSRQKNQNVKMIHLEKMNILKRWIWEKEEHKIPFQRRHRESLVDHNKLELPASKRPNQEGRTDDPNHCAYHRMIPNPLKDCFILMKKKKDQRDVEGWGYLFQSDIQPSEHGLLWMVWAGFLWFASYFYDREISGCKQSPG